MRTSTVLPRAALAMVLACLTVPVVPIGILDAQDSSDAAITANGIGPVKLSMTEAELVELLGPDAVRRSESYVGEGFCAPGSIVFPGTDEAIQVTWQDTTYSAITELAITREGSGWRTARGVGIGTTLKELEEIAGAPLRFSGFGWDYGGMSAWNEEDLRAAIRLNPTRESDALVRDDERYREIFGDRTVASDHPVIRQMTIIVRQLSLRGVASGGTQFECG